MPKAGRIEREMVIKPKVRFIWIVWLIAWPLLLWTSTTIYFMNIEGQLIDIMIFGMFMSIVALFPLQINDRYIYFINGISIAVFLLYGLFAEIILSQFTIIVVLLSSGINKKDLYRIPLNMLAFSLVSFAGAEVYFHLGGNHGDINYQNFTEVLAVLCYAITMFIMNQLLGIIIDKYFFNRKIKLIDKAMKWEFSSLLIVLPVGFVLFLLYVEIGRIGIFYLGIPFIFISIILRLLYSYQNLNRYLEKTAEIGHKLTKRFNLAEVYDVFIKEIIKLFSVDFVFLYSVTDDGRLELVRYYDSSNSIESPVRFLSLDKRIGGKSWVSGKPITYSKKEDQVTLRNAGIPIEAKSVLSFAIQYDSITTGIITIGSRKQKAFNGIHYKILDIIITYLGIATENARNLEKTRAKSEKDGLTNLFNYKYFEEYLDNIDVSGTVSLLLLDLDHFKAVNDTYGHEAGNQILTEVARRLKDAVNDKGLLARYGGEEFAVILPGKGREQASEIGEILRSVIGDIPYVICNHLLKNSESIELNVTTSVGLATYPDHCNVPNELIRHADRAMYIGAKRQGRNKVAIYEDLKTK